MSITLNDIRVNPQSSDCFLLPVEEEIQITVILKPSKPQVSHGLWTRIDYRSLSSLPFEASDYGPLPTENDKAVIIGSDISKPDMDIGASFVHCRNDEGEELQER
jgi:hypothetical protein